MAEQLSFSLPVRTALGRDDFFVSPANAVALGLIDTWPAWPGGKLLLAGPEGSGKTHLAHVWAAVAQAPVILAAELSESDVPTLARGHVAIEDVPALSGNDVGQRALFHLHNLVLAEGGTLLLTGTGDPLYWGLDLPDLKSRMQGTTVAALDYPDDALLGAVLLKLFADRQLLPGVEVVPFLLRYMNRTFRDARRIVDRLDALSLSELRPVTRALARRALDTLTQDD